MTQVNPDKRENKSTRGDRGAPEFEQFESVPDTFDSLNETTDLTDGDDSWGPMLPAGGWLRSCRRPIPSAGQSPHSERGRQRSYVLSRHGGTSLILICRRPIPSAGQGPPSGEGTGTGATRPGLCCAGSRALGRVHPRRGDGTGATRPGLCCAGSRALGRVHPRRGDGTGATRPGLCCAGSQRWAGSTLGEGTAQELRDQEFACAGTPSAGQSPPSERGRHRSDPGD